MSSGLGPAEVHKFKTHQFLQKDTTLLTVEACQRSTPNAVTQLLTRCSCSKFSFLSPWLLLNVFLDRFFFSGVPCPSLCLFLPLLTPCALRGMFSNTGKSLRGLLSGQVWMELEGVKQVMEERSSDPNCVSTSTHPESLEPPPGCESPSPRSELESSPHISSIRAPQSTFSTFCFSLSIFRSLSLSFSRRCLLDFCKSQRL